MRLIKYILVLLILGVVPGSAIAAESPEPYLSENDRTMIPVRMVSEKLGYDVEWEKDSKSAIITKEETEMKVTVGKSNAVIDGEEVTVDSPAVIKEDTIFLPVQFIAENYGWDVRYNDRGPSAVVTLKKDGMTENIVISSGGSNKTISRGGETYRYKEKLEMVSTAYTYTGNNTATGIAPRRGIVAVDPDVIPLGTRLYVENYGVCEAQDTGGAIKGNKIDVFVESRQKAYRWGVRNVNVYVLE